jgi:uncharacterized protein YodC (DUF2158 family)
MEYTKSEIATLRHIDAQIYSHQHLTDEWIQANKDEDGKFYWEADICKDLLFCLFLLKKMNTELTELRHQKGERMTFKKGDVVVDVWNEKIIKMTVESIEGGSVACVWFEGGELNRENFPSECLAVVM